jgi:hypothetical protein
MHAWATFWAVCTAGAGACFAGMTVVVAVRGVRDLRELFHHLRARRPAAAPGLARPDVPGEAPRPARPQEAP